MSSSISSLVSILLNFLSVATLAGGTLELVNLSIIFSVLFPEILITASPDIPWPVDNAKIVITEVYQEILKKNY